MIINQEECKLVPDFNAYHISESGRIYRTSSSKKRLQFKENDCRRDTSSHKYQSIIERKEP